MSDIRKQQQTTDEVESSLRGFSSKIVGPALNHGRRIERGEDIGTTDYRKEKVAVYQNADDVLEQYATNRVISELKRLKKKTTCGAGILCDQDQCCDGMHMGTPELIEDRIKSLQDGGKE